jgi:hypothetical protein
MGKTARFGPAANVTLAGGKIVVRYNRPNREHGGCEADFPFLIQLQPLPRLYAHVTGGLGVVEKLKGRYHTLKEKKASSAEFVGQLRFRRTAGGSLL